MDQANDNAHPQQQKHPLHPEEQMSVEDLSLAVTNISDRQSEISEILGRLHRSIRHEHSANEKLEEKIDWLFTRCQQVMEEFGLTVQEASTEDFRTLLKVALKKPGATKNSTKFLYPVLEKAVASFTDVLSTKHSRLSALLLKRLAEPICSI